MPMSCSILGCSNRHSKGKNIKFFHFPLKDKCQLTAWLNAIKRQNWIPSKNDRICNEHFTTNDYLCRPDAHYTHLKQTAIPSIFPSFVKSNKKDQCKIINTNNENKDDEMDNLEKNNKSYDENFTNIYIESTIQDSTNQNIYSSHINVQSKNDENGENNENMHTIVDIVEEPNIYNVNSNINLEICKSETTVTEELRVTSSPIYESMDIEENQVNDKLDCSKFHCIKNSPTPIEINLHKKIRILQRKIRRRDAKIIYLRRVLTNLKQKKHILSVIQRL